MVDYPPDEAETLATDPRYYTPLEVANLLGVSHERVRQLAQKGRIAGAFKIGPKNWAIPDDFDLVLPDSSKGPMNRMSLRIEELREEGVLRRPGEPQEMRVDRSEERSVNRYEAHQTLEDVTYVSNEARILFEIARGKDVSRFGLSRKVGLDPSYVSRILARLEHRGLINKVRSEADRRQIIVALTPEAEKAFSMLEVHPREDAMEETIQREREARAQLLAETKATLEEAQHHSREWEQAFRDQVQAFRDQERRYNHIVQENAALVEEHHRDMENCRREIRRLQILLDELDTLCRAAVSELEECGRTEMASLIRASIENLRGARQSEEGNQ